MRMSIATTICYFFLRLLTQLKMEQVFEQNLIQAAKAVEEQVRSEKSRLNESKFIDG